jgi:epoxyqueuosine reductase
MEDINLDGWIYGCDACQNVCPFNQHASEHRNSLFDPLFNPLSFDSGAWLSMSDKEFEKLAGETAMTRAGLARIKENIG